MAEIDPLLGSKHMKRGKGQLQTFYEFKMHIRFWKQHFQIYSGGSYIVEDYSYRSSNIQYLFVRADMREQILRKLNIGLQNKVSFAYYNHWIWNNMKKLLNFDKDLFYLFYEIY